MVVNVPTISRLVPGDLVRSLIRFAVNHPVLTLIALNLILTMMVYVPLYEHRPGDGLYLNFSGLSMDNIYRYWDGPLYLIVAKGFYSLGGPELFVYDHLDPGYYAAHFPAYPATIKLFSYVFGYANGMIAATIAATTLALWVFYLLLKDLGIGRHALLLGVFFLVLPPRWLIYHSVGASEPLFIFSFLAFILFYRRQQYWLAGLMGVLAVLTRSPGFMLLAVYLAIEGWSFLRSQDRPSFRSFFMKKLLPMAPFAAAPLVLFGFYHIQYGDFWAYFHSGDNIHLTAAPFASIWPSITGDNWAESALWIYLLNAVGILLLWRHGFKDLALFAGVLYVPLIFVAHHDLARYMMPIFPLSLIIAYHRLLIAKEFRLAMLLIIPAIYIYTWSGVQTNLAPEEPTRQLFAILGR